MTQIIKEKASGTVKKYLKEWWETQTKQNKDISRRRRRKNKIWLSDYEKSFQIEYSNKSPFFKPDEIKENTRIQRTQHGHISYSDATQRDKLQNNGKQQTNRQRTTYNLADRKTHAIKEVKSTVQNNNDHDIIPGNQ